MYLLTFYVGVFRLPLTYVLSSMWHGVEPGYYLTFLSIVPVTIAAKKVYLSLSVTVFGAFIYVFGRSLQIKSCG